MQIDLAVEYLKWVIEKDFTHKNYKRVCELAVKYKAYYTGEGLNDYLQQIVTRETKEEFDQRCLLTKHITPSILNSTKLPFAKAARKRPTVRKIDFKSDADTKKTEVELFMSKFNGKRTLEQYLEEFLIEYNYIDPNAFLIVEFEPNDETQKVNPYPFIATSEQSIDFNYKNGIIDYLIVRLPIKYTEDNISKDGFKWTMYNGNETIVIQTVPKDEILPGYEYINITGKSEKLSFKIYDVKAKNDIDLLPSAIRFGFIKDPVTFYETYVSVGHSVMPYLEKTLKINSELDQSTAMTAFPQRFKYTSKCTNPDCHNGILVTKGENCPVCQGTGRQLAHSGTQQVETFILPENPADIFDLEKILVYKMPPIELLEFQNNFIKQLKIDCHTAMFNADIFSKTEVTATATEKILETDNMNDALFPFTRQYSNLWEHCVYFIAAYTDNAKKNDELTIQHQFPFDLKMKGLTELMTDLKTAYDSNATKSTISAIEDDINEILYSDRPEELKKIKIQSYFNPFKGYSPDDIKYIISSGLSSKFDQILYANFYNIFSELERENTNPWIYDLELTKIYEKLKTKISDKITQIESEQPKQLNNQWYGQEKTNQVNKESDAE
jgi:uncharacterized protein (DUF3820 family)